MALLALRGRSVTARCSRPTRRRWRPSWRPLRAEGLHGEAGAEALPCCEALLAGTVDERRAIIATLTRRADADAVALLRWALGAADPRPGGRGGAGAGRDDRIVRVADDPAAPGDLRRAGGRRRARRGGADHGRHRGRHRRAGAGLLAGPRGTPVLHGRRGRSHARRRSGGSGARAWSWRCCSPDAALAAIDEAVDSVDPEARDVLRALRDEAVVATHALRLGERVGPGQLPPGRAAAAGGSPKAVRRPPGSVRTSPAVAPRAAACRSASCKSLRQRPPGRFLLKSPEGTTTAADVCLLVEGTYPFVAGGVSSWVHDIIKGHPELTFAVLNVGSHPAAYGEPRYQLPENVVGLHRVFCQETAKPPLDGDERAELREEIRRIRSARSRCAGGAVARPRGAAPPAPGGRPQSRDLAGAS